MFNYDEYFASVIGKKVNVYGDQCVGLFNDYLNKFLGYNFHVSCVNAFDLYEQRKSNGILKYFYEVNVKDMQKGDVCLWKWDGVSTKDPEFHNHVSIFHAWADTNKTKAYFYEQNFPNDLKHRYVTKNVHTIKVLKGVLRPKYTIKVGNTVTYTKAYDRPFNTANDKSRTPGKGKVIAITDFVKSFDTDGQVYFSNNYIVNTGSTVVFVKMEDITNA